MGIPPWLYTLHEWILHTGPPAQVGPPSWTLRPDPPAGPPGRTPGPDPWAGSLAQIILIESHPLPGV